MHNKHNWMLLVVVAALLLILPAAGASQAATDDPPPIPIPIDLPDEAVAVPPGMGADSIAALSPQIPSHALGRGRAPGGGGCDKDIDLTSTIEGVVNVDAVDTGICSNADIDSYTGAGSKTYVVIAGQEEAAWTHIDVTDPANSFVVAQYVWIRSAKGTNSPDIKAFHQGTRDYIALATERGGPLGNKGTCGVYIFDVTEPANAVQVSRIIESGVWCSVHNVFVEDDAIEGGPYLYITANSSADLRVYNIANPANPVKLGTYQRAVRGFGGSGFYDDIYVHDVTVQDGTVYASYWEAGLDMFPSSLVQTTDALINENHPAVTKIDLIPDFAPARPFLVHHAFASGDGSLVGIEDEIEISSGAEVVQLWTTSPISKLDGLEQGSDVPMLPAHNLEIRDDLFPNRLFVGWYKAGMRAWDFNATGFTRLNSAQATVVLIHQVQTETADGAYSGAWGVRLEQIGGNKYIFTSDRNFGLIVDCVGCTETVGTVTGVVTDSSNGKPIAGATVSADTGQIDTTDDGGNYMLDNVPTGAGTLTASASGYASKSTTTSVTDGLTTVVDFALDPEPEPSSTGTVKGKVTDASTGKNLSEVMVTIVETGQNDTTNKGGRYSINDVPEGSVIVVKASKLGFVDEEKTVIVIAGQSTTVNFALLPD
ncbi:MAG: carboxypeptidase-like regulatory domain-containing protein [Chloroflexi bacterium]|nr:carboxypeptidase-like regulatory domain-containing protein [Chloroflexota bacterium]